MRLAYFLSFTLFAFTGCIDEAADELPFDGEADPTGKADDATVSFTTFDNPNVSSSRRQRGGTYVLTSKQAWYRVMGTASPASVDFSKEWVVFYGMGVRNTGGYAAAVTGLSYDAADRSLTVTTHASSPGAGCIVTQALTTPHHVVKFKIPSPRPLYALGDHSDEVRDCSAPETLLEYRYGNQISASDLVLMSDGTIDHEERRTPTNIERVSHARLSSTQLAQVRAQIAAAANGSLTKSDGGATNLGSSSGYLHAFLADGTKVVIQLDARDEDGDGLNDVTNNTAPEATALRAMVLGLVDRDLP